MVAPPRPRVSLPPFWLSVAGLAGLVAGALAIGLPSTAGAQTTLPSGTLSSNLRTWTATGSPYIIPTGGVLVPVGAELRIQAGVRVRSASNGGFLEVEGGLRVEGTATDPVQFGQVNSTSTFTGILIQETGTSTIQHAEFARCGTGCVNDQSGRTIVEDSSFFAGYSAINWRNNIPSRTARVTRTTIEGFTIGLWLEETQNRVEVRNVEIIRCSRGIWVYGGRLDLYDSLIRDSFSTGIDFDTRSWLTSGPHRVLRNTIAGGNFGLLTRIPASTNPAIELADNAFIFQSSWNVAANAATNVDHHHNLFFSTSGNLHIGGIGLTKDPTEIIGNPTTVNDADDFRPTSLSPLRGRSSTGGDIGKFAYSGVQTVNYRGWLNANATFTKAGSPYRIVGDLTVPEGLELTVEAGAQVLFADNADAGGEGRDRARAELRVAGGLRVNGSPTDPATFDTDLAAGATPGASDYEGLVLLPTATATLTHVRIEHARGGVIDEGTDPGRASVQNLFATGGEVGVHVVSGHLTVEESTLSGLSQHGILIHGGRPTFDRVLVANNLSHGVVVRARQGCCTTLSIPATLRRLTVVRNSGDGVQLGDYATSSIFQSSIIAFNSGYGMRVHNSHSVRRIIMHSNRSNFAPGRAISGTSWGVRIDPRFVGASDYRLSDDSPARRYGVDGSDAGAFPYTGTANPPAIGRISQSTTWSGTVYVTGDVTVDAGRSLTIMPGTEVIISDLDLLATGANTQQIEIDVEGRIDMVGTRTNPIIVRSESGRSRRWTGFILDALSTGCEMEWAFIKHANTGITVRGGFGHRLRYLDISEGGNYGVYVTGDPIITLHGLRVHNNTGTGLEVRLSSRSQTVTSLLAYDNGSYGFRSTRNSSTFTSSITLQGATLVDNGRSGAIMSGSGEATNVIATGNNWWGLDASTAVVSRAVALYGNRYTGRPSTVSCTASFVDRTHGNFALTGTSGCLDRGVSVPGRFDAEGNPRSRSATSSVAGAPDLGAFEYQANGNRYPVARFNSLTSSLIVEVGETLQLDGRGSSDVDGSIVAYLWDFGDGRTASGSTTSVSYNTSTDYDVSLTVIDNLGYRDRLTRRVITNRLPVANAGVDRTGDLGELFAFSANGSFDPDGTISSYLWDFGDGTTGTGNPGLRRYSAAGQYLVQLTVVDNQGSRATDTARVTVGGGADTISPAITYTAPGPVVENAPVTITARIVDVGIISSARLYYRTGTTGAFQSVAMSGGPIYSATLPAAVVQRPSLQVYVEATDNASNIGRSPATAPAATHTINVRASQPPALVHIPVPNGRPFGTPVVLTARATSAAGVSQVEVFHRISGATAFTRTLMTGAGSGNFTAVLAPLAVQNPGVEYYVLASDTSVPALTARSPASGVHSFTVIGSGDTQPPTIIHAPLTRAVPAGRGVTVTASVSDSSGVASVTLRYRRVGDATFTSLALSQTAPGQYEATVPGANVQRPAMEYYLEAVDSSAISNRAYAPGSAPAVPARFDVLRSFNLAPGDLVITEIMADPTGNEAEREWFEVYNPTARSLDLDGIQFRSGSESFIVSEGGPVTIAPGAYLVFGRTSSTTLNGGVTVDVQYSGLTFSNAADQLVVAADAVDVDLVSYDASTHPIVEGRSLNLASGALDASSNDDARSWCEARAPLSGGDFGTPGTANGDCGDIVAPVIGHTPIVDDQPEGVPVTFTATVTDDRQVASVRVHHRRIGDSNFERLTLQSGGGAAWFGTTTSTVVARPGIEYYLEARDGAGNVAWFPAMAPPVRLDFSVQRVFQLSAGDLVVTEIMADPTGNEAEREWLEIYNPTSAAIDLDGLRFESDAGATIIDRPGTMVAAGGLYVLGVNDDSATNGGAMVDLVYAGLPLGNGAGDLSVRAGALVVDAVRWTSAYPQQEGRSLNLASGALDAASNDVAQAWCVASTMMSGGDFGTPGTVNGTCADLIPPTIALAPIPNGRPDGEAVTITATASDDRGLAAVTLHYRAVGGTSFTTAAMNATGRGTYFADIPGGQVGRPGVEYYVAAIDDAGNQAFFPALAPVTPLAFTVERTFRLAAGDLVVTEIMARPTGSQALQEWFEVFNASASTIDLDGLTFGGGGIEGFTVDARGTLPVAAGAYAVLGRSTNTSTNGGVRVDYAYDGLGFSNTDDSLRILAGTQVIDEISYANTTHPLRAGRSLSLNPGAVDASSNDSGANWCYGLSVLSGGDYGTPSAVNDACADELAPVIVHTPVADGQPASRAVPVTAQVTDQGTGLDQVRLFYRTVGAPGFSEVVMTSIGGDSFQGGIPASEVTTAGVEYYLRAVDLGPLPNETLVPGAGATAPHRFMVTEVDTAAPNLVHTPPSGPLLAGEEVELVVAIADTSGISEAELVLADGARQALVGSGLRYDVTVARDAVVGPELAYHFEATDRFGNEARLPASGRFEVAVRTPDDIAPAIEHSPFTEAQDADAPVRLTATITDANGIAEARLRVRAAGARTFVALDLEADGDEWSVELDPALLSVETLEYFFEAVDGAEEQNLGRRPAMAPSETFTLELFGVGAEDLDPPLIVHAVPGDLSAFEDTVPFEAAVVDLSGVEEVRAFVRTKKDGGFSPEAVTSVGQDRYRFELAKSVVETGVAYYFEAVDATPAQNQAVLPAAGEGGPFEIAGAVDDNAGGDPPASGDGGGCRTTGPAASGWLASLLLLAFLRRRRPATS